MIISVGIVNVHVFKKPLDVLVEEALHFSVTELRINKEGTNVRLHDIRKGLKVNLRDKKLIREVELGYLWSCLCQSPIVSSTIRVFLRLFKILHVFAILAFDDCAVGSKMLVKTKLHRYCGKELIRHHGHLRAVSQICAM